MLKKDLIDLVSADTGVAKKTIRRVMDAIVDRTTRGLIAGQAVPLFGLGKMSISKRGPKVARNIHTGASVVVPARNAVVMAPSDALVKAVNADGQA